MIINMDTIVVDPNPLLRQKAAKVALPLNDEDRQLLTEMLEYVERSQNDEIAEQENLQPAVGIAAPQVGVLKQMTAVVVNETDEEGNIISKNRFALVNPKIVSHSKKETALPTGEGCLSVRDPHEGYVYRPERVTIEAYDMITDQVLTIKAKGYLAVVLQHELDHLKGILFYDHINQEDPWRLKNNANLL